jgi:hypothetical protein
MQVDMNKLYTEEQVLEILAKTIEMTLSAQRCKELGMSGDQAGIKMSNDVNNNWRLNLYLAKMNLDAITKIKTP